MNNQIQGMDTDEVRTQARQMDSHAGVVGDALAGLMSHVGGLKWFGTDQIGFAEKFNAVLMPQAKGGISSLQENAQAMRTASDRQDQASA